MSLSLGSWTSLCIGSASSALSWTKFGPLIHLACSEVLASSVTTRFLVCLSPSGSYFPSSRYGSRLPSNELNPSRLSSNALKPDYSGAFKELALDNCLSFLFCLIPVGFKLSRVSLIAASAYAMFVSLSL